MTPLQDIQAKAEAIVLLAKQLQAESEPMPPTTPTKLLLLSSGHGNVAGKDRGAVGNGLIEGEEMVKLRNKMVDICWDRGIRVVTDPDRYLAADTYKHFAALIEPGCLAVDLHLNSASASATGVEVIVKDNPSKRTVDVAQKVAKVISNRLGVPLRKGWTGNPPAGVKWMSDTPHGSIKFLTLNCDAILIEICFISNPKDVEAYQNATDIPELLITEIFEFL